MRTRFARIPILVVAVLVALGLAAAACDDADSGDPEAIHGTWITGLEGQYLTFNENGSWTAQAVLDVEAFRDAGTFTFDGEILTVNSDPDYSCATYADGSEQGSYEVDVADEDTLDPTVIDDPCTPRANDFTSGMVRYSP
jgi:hypothetical protein